MEEIIDFGGILDTATAGKHVSSRIQEQPDADDLQLGRARRVDELHDVEATTCMSFNKGCSIMHFSENMKLWIRHTH